MATLYRHPKSRYWWTSFFDRTGKRVSRSTGQIKKTEARDVAHTLELREKRAKKENAGLQLEMAELVSKAAIEAGKGRLSLEKAQEMIRDLYEIANHSAFPGLTVGQWLDQWLKGKESEVKAKSMKVLPLQLLK